MGNVTRRQNNFTEAKLEVHAFLMWKGEKKKITNNIIDGISQDFYHASPLQTVLIMYAIMKHAYVYFSILVYFLIILQTVYGRAVKAVSNVKLFNAYIAWNIMSLRIRNIPFDSWSAKKEYLDKDKQIKDSVNHFPSSIKDIKDTWWKVI